MCWLVHSGPSECKGLFRHAGYEPLLPGRAVRRGKLGDPKSCSVHGGIAKWFEVQPRRREAVDESWVGLCGADRAFIFRFDGELLRMAVAYNAPREFEDWVARHPIRPG